LATGFNHIGDELYEIRKGIDLFGSVYRELTLNYAENLDPVLLLRAGIKGMLSTIDPYTTFIEEKDKVDIDMLTTGSYSGIGISVVHRNGKHIVSNILSDELWEGKQLRIGDEIVRVDSINVEQDNVQDLKNLLRGKSGTTVSLTIRIPGLEALVVRQIPRRDIHIRSIAYSMRVNRSILYIKMDRFTRSAGEDIRIALKSFSTDTTAKGIVLDLRDNPGGLLDASVDVVKKFVPNKSLIVSTRGRQPHYNKEYYSDSEPIAGSLPLAILINQNSASASEIVAGAIQDLDRGVIIGTRSFGKGLVQTVIPLNYNASLKVTTSKYYIPSGRCIQKTSYSRILLEGKGAKANDDTVKLFRTLVLQRPVRNAGGIEPDITVTNDSISTFTQRLIQTGILFDFVTDYINRNSIPGIPKIDEKVKKAFRVYMASHTTDTILTVSKSFSQFIEAAKRDGIQPSLLKKLYAFAPQVAAECIQTLEMKWLEISEALTDEFAYHLGGKQLRFQKTMQNDKYLQTALSLLEEKKKYSVVLHPIH